MAIENFTTYTEVDPNARITKTATRVTWAGLTRSETAYVYDDKGAAYFSGDFIHLLTVCMTASVEAAQTQPWTLANLLDDLDGIDAANGDYLSILMFHSSATHARHIVIRECDGGTTYQSSSYTISLDTPYYLKVYRDESVGTHGTLYCGIYSDSARETLLATLSLALHTSKKDFRYIYACQTQGASGTYAMSAYSEYLSITGGITYTGEYFPSDPSARVSSIRHIFQPGMFRMQVGVGDLGFDIDVAEATARRELDTAKEVEKAEPEPVVPKPTVPAPTAPEITEVVRDGTVVRTTTPKPSDITPRTYDIMQTEAYKATEIRRKGLELQKKGYDINVITPYAIDVLKKNEQAAKLLTEISKLSTSSRTPGITDYARQVLQRRIAELQSQLRDVYGR